MSNVEDISATIPRYIQIFDLWSLTCPRRGFGGFFAEGARFFSGMDQASAAAVAARPANFLGRAFAVSRRGGAGSSIKNLFGQRFPSKKP
ncbi:MAG: hypothetical protein LBT97_04080 [Planctomycetota bacterium]|jgi:hypothetical protein|nr:hypothetical protein [Planctomycetota bacterium]